MEVNKEDKKIVLGLDLGTNSIGWAIVEIDRKNRVVRIIGLGSRILPMDAGEIKKFEEGGKIESTASQRTTKRSPRKLNQRFTLRRDRLHLVLNLLKALPEHYAIEIDFERNNKKCGQFKEDKEPKMAYKLKEENSKYEFYFEDAFNEMIEDLKKVNPEIKNEKGCKVTKDWTLYYLRQKALKKKISLEELAWVLLSYNQKRGYEKLEVEDEENLFYEKLKNFGISEKNAQKIGIARKDVQIENLNIKVEKVKPIETPYLGYRIYLKNGYSYDEYTTKQLTFSELNNTDTKEIETLHFVDESMNILEEKSLYKVSDIYTLKIDKVIYQKNGKKHNYILVFENGWKKDYSKSKPTKQYENLVGKEVHIIVTTIYNNKGKIVKPSISIDKIVNKPNKDEIPRKIDDFNVDENWTLLKKKTEKEAIQFNIENGFIDEKTGSAKNYISPKIYDVLKNDAKTGNRTKIIGGMFQVVERKFYRDELNQIIETQRKHHLNLDDDKVFEDCVKLLYPNNKQHAENLLKNKKAIQNLLVDDVLLYQRDLKSKKSEIADCKYEVRHWEHTGKEIIDKVTGEICKEVIPHYQKVLSVSHPLYQEFRIWDKIHNLKLIQLEKKDGDGTETNVDVTKEYFKSSEDYQKLFDLFNNQKTVNQKQFLKFCKDNFNIAKDDFVWNYPEDEELKGNETRVSFAFRFKRCGFPDYQAFLTPEKEIALWHYLYSVNYKERNNNDKKSCKTFFNNLFVDHEIGESVLDKIITDFANFPKFDARYGAYSEKALKKLLPFIRLSKNRFKGQFIVSAEMQEHLKVIEYDEKNIAKHLQLSSASQKDRTKEQRQEVEQLKQNIYEALWKNSINERVHSIKDKLSKIDFTQNEIDYSSVVKVEVDEQKGELAFPKGLFNAFKEHKTVNAFTDLNLTQASYLVYGRHSELSKAKFWRSPEQVREGISSELKQHSLNNPVAEKVLREMMQIVADIWDYFGDGKEDYFSKIHLEVGRELKKSVSEKDAENKKQKGNREQNKRLRQILKEFLSSKPYNAIPNNSDHFERLKIIENSVLHQTQYTKDYFKTKKDYTKEEIEEILKEPKISKTQFEKYKLWIEQGYQSPYTGSFIKFTELFDGNKYNIDHVFPRASVTNDSLNNKVVCETEINKKKGKLTGREFILKNENQIFKIDEGNGERELKVLSDHAYVSLVKGRFSKNKQYILLAKEVPTGFTSSQLNNARHIARKAMGLLSHIVREQNEVEYRSKNILPVTGKVTSDLKEAWRLNEIWTELLSPRFKRLNELTQSDLFGKEQTSKSGHTYFDCNLHDSIREKNPDYNIKRLDHRHHALDALIIALCTEDHVAYINNINAGIDPKKKNDKEKLRKIQNQRSSLKQRIKYSVPNKENPNNKNWHYLPPGAYHNDEINGQGKDSVIELSFEFDKEKGFYKDVVFNALKNTVVTFKKKKSPIRKTSNKYSSYYDEEGKLRLQNGKPLKKITKQVDENSVKYDSINKRNIAIRRNMHDEQPYGETILDFEVLEIAKNLKNRKDIIDSELRTSLEDLIINCDCDLSKVEKELSEDPLKDENNNAITHTAFRLRDRKTFYKIRKNLSEITNEKQLRKVADAQLQKDLLFHIAKYDNDYKEAFSPLGIDDFNKHRKIPVKKVTFVEGGRGRYVLGKKNFKESHKKLVKGANHCFVIDRKKNEYYTISLKALIDDYYKEIKVETENKEKFYLSEGELVYVPTDKELENIDKFKIENIDFNRIYKFVNSSGTTANFVPFRVANVLWCFHKDKSKKEIYKILQDLGGINILEKALIKDEFGLGSQQSKHQKSLEGLMIKDRCWKLKTDRLGNIIEILK